LENRRPYNSPPAAAAYFGKCEWRQLVEDAGSERGARTGTKLTRFHSGRGIVWFT